MHTQQGKSNHVGHVCAIDNNMLLSVIGNNCMSNRPLIARAERVQLKLVGSAIITKSHEKSMLELVTS